MTHHKRHPVVAMESDGQETLFGVGVENGQVSGERGELIGGGKRKEYSKEVLIKKSQAERRVKENKELGQSKRSRHSYNLADRKASMLM